MTKSCSQGEACVHPDGPELPLDQFYKRKDSRAGTRNECKICMRQKFKTHRDKNKEYYREYRSNNREYFLEYNKQYRENNKELFKTYYKKRRENGDDSAEYYIKNKDAILECHKQYRKNNKGKVNALTRKYQAAKLNAIPPWADLEAIKQVYMDCEEINLAAKTAGCTETFVVDHYIPLQGKLVSGLHVEANLQIITTAQNAEKGNKFNPRFGV